MSKEYLVEEDEMRDMKERLESLVEELRQLDEGNEDSSDGYGHDVDGDDY